MGSRPGSPGSDPAPSCRAQPSEPRPAKRPRLQEPAQMEFQKVPGLPDPAGPPAAAPRISVLLLDENSAIKVLLDDADLLLQPHPTEALRVCLPGHTLVLVPEALVRWAQRQAGDLGGHLPEDLQPCALLGANGEVVAVQVGAFRADFPEELGAPPPRQPPLPLEPGMGPAAGRVGGPSPEVLRGAIPDPPGPPLQPWLWAPTPSPQRRSQGPCFSLRGHQPQACLGSALQPLPASPSPGPRERPKSFPGRPRCKARRRLFQE